MKVVLIDASLAGASGDKILSAMADTITNTEKLGEAISKALEATGKFHGSVRFRSLESHGVCGKRLEADFGKARLDPEGMRKALADASGAAGLEERGRSRAEECLELLLSSESNVHGAPHIHEVGEADTIVDIVGTMLAVQMLGLDEASFYTAPIAVGSGSVNSRHGRLPVPAPATTAILLKHKLPITGTQLLGELTTPTGAALIACLTEGKTEPPPFRVVSVGVGLGNRELRMPNITRVMIASSDDREGIKILETNLDDVSGEIVGWLVESLQGKVEDVTVLPMVTKKNRPGFTIRVVVRAEQLEAATEILMRETGTLGVKVIDCRRLRAEWRLVRRTVVIGGKAHDVRFKVSDRGPRMKPEYEDLRRIARDVNLSLREVMEEALRQARQK